ncbi:MAG: hypothetical protein V4654_00385 [Bdellovibrionota bacterium]
MNTLKKLLVLSLFFNFSCTKEELEEIAAGTTPTDGSQTAAQLAGGASLGGLRCDVETTVGGTYAAVKQLTLNANGTYTYSVFFSNSATCATAFASGGNNIATLYTAGVWAVGGTNTTPSTSTKIVFVVGSANMIIRSSTYTATAQPLATWFNTCSPNPGFNTAADDTQDVAGVACGTSGQYAAVTIPAANATLNNIGYNPGGGSFSLGNSTGQTVWYPGGSSFPNSYGFTLGFW